MTGPSAREQEQATLDAALIEPEARVIACRCACWHDGFRAGYSGRDSLVESLKQRLDTAESILRYIPDPRTHR